MIVEIHKNLDGTVNVVYDKNRKAHGVLRVFVTDERKNGNERPGMGNILADFAWRRSVNMSDIKKDKTFITTISEYLKTPATDLRFHFNRNCGCDMCPCSPGILVQHAIPGLNHLSAPEIWVTVKDDQIPMLTEAYETHDGAEVEIDINAFQERMNLVP